MRGTSNYIIRFRLGIDGETDDGTKPGRRKGRQKPVKNSRNSRPGENGTAPVAGRKNKRVSYFMTGFFLTRFFKY